MPDIQVVLRRRPTVDGGLSTTEKSSIMVGPSTGGWLEEGEPEKRVPPLPHDLWFIIFVKKVGP